MKIFQLNGNHHTIFDLLCYAHKIPGTVFLLVFEKHFFTCVLSRKRVCYSKGCNILKSSICGDISIDNSSVSL